MRRGIARKDMAPAARRAGAAALLVLLPLALVGLAALEAPALPRRDRDIRLVLHITIDQLRGDMALRVRDRWSENGFRELFEEGTAFADAHHPHANTETIVGHVTLASGAPPAVHGMVGNVWLDRSTGAMQYNIEDLRYEVVGNDGAAGPAAGHAETVKPKRGRSPEAILAPTIADSIAAKGGKDAKIWAVSLKDRGAVPMAGRSGKAIWWSEATGEFISSSYYFPDRKLPEWARQWNEDHGADHLDGQSWHLLLDPSSYNAAGKDDMPWEAPPKGQTRVFPHRLDRRQLGDSYYLAVEASPFGDDLELDFARRLMRAEELGEDEVTDYLSVAFSANDFIGHRYGPSSLEMEDEVLRLDRVLAVLLEAAEDAADGEEHLLVILSSDHGVAEAPEQLIADGHDAGRVPLSSVQKSPVIEKLNKRFGGNVIRKSWPPYVYLDNEGLRKKHMDPEKVARTVAEEFAKLPGVERAFTRGQILGGELPDIDIARAVKASFHPDRSGDIHIVPKYGWQIAYEGESALRYATGHGTPWPYDTFVPLVFAGPGIRQKLVLRRVETTDVAPTIAALLGIPPPAKATGKVLEEVLK